MNQVICILFSFLLVNFLFGSVQFSTLAITFAISKALGIFLLFLLFASPYTQSKTTGAKTVVMTTRASRHFRFVASLNDVEATNKRSGH